MDRRRCHDGKSIYEADCSSYGARSFGTKQPIERIAKTAYPSMEAQGDDATDLKFNVCVAGEGAAWSGLESIVRISCRNRERCSASIY